MSDSIKHNGKTYFEGGLLNLANENAERSRVALESEKQRNGYLQEQLAGWERWHARISGHIGCKDDRVESENTIRRMVGKVGWENCTHCCELRNAQNPCMCE